MLKSPVTVSDFGPAESERFTGSPTFLSDASIVAYPVPAASEPMVSLEMFSPLPTFIVPTVMSAWLPSLPAAPKTTPFAHVPFVPVYVNVPIFQLELDAVDVSFICVEPPVSL